MQYGKIVAGRFLNRPNRFVAQVELDGQVCTAHVKNTGRCQELLLPGARVYLQDFTDDMGTRKLPYALVAAEKERPGGTLLVNLDSQAPNRVVGEALREGRLPLPGLGELAEIRPELSCGESRLDFFVRDREGREGFLEVKGVTLETDGVASFPDAPTLRGIKHLHTLSALAREGKNAYVLFVLQMKQMCCFIPNAQRHEDFARALRQAQKAGVAVLAYDCAVTPDSLRLDQPVEVRL